VTYLMGGKAADGTKVAAKYVGNRRLIETAVATLATDRALLAAGITGLRPSRGSPNTWPLPSPAARSG